MNAKNDFAKKALLIGVAAVLLVLVLAVLLAFGFSAAIPLQKEVAVIPLHGEISNFSGGYSESYSALELVDLLEEAKEDQSIGVIFLDIDSPGGSVVATKQVVAKIREVKGSKPVVAYIGEVGASGAYYVASASNYIISDADSITGSIGVISIFPSISELLEKIGVKVDIIKAGEFKAAGNPFEEMTPQERKIVEKIVSETFDQFRSDVLSFRSDKLSRTDFETIADGRILSGRQALSHHLVDELLTREEAIQKAAGIGGIQGKPKLREYAKPLPSLFDLFSFSGKAFANGFRESVSIQESQVPRVRA